MCGKPDASHQLNTASIDDRSQHKQLGFKFPLHIILAIYSLVIISNNAEMSPLEKGIFPPIFEGLCQEK
jgi:hypothetical protein